MKKLFAQVKMKTLKILDFQKKNILDETFSDWSECPASCKDRPVPKRFRWSSHGNVQSEDCAASTAECREYKLYNLFCIKLLCNYSLRYIKLS